MAGNQPKVEKGETKEGPSILSLFFPTEPSLSPNLPDLLSIIFPYRVISDHGRNSPSLMTDGHEKKGMRSSSFSNPKNTTSSLLLAFEIIDRRRLQRHHVATADGRSKNRRWSSSEHCRTMQTCRGRQTVLYSCVVVLINGLGRAYLQTVWGVNKIAFGSGLVA